VVRRYTPIRDGTSVTDAAIGEAIREQREAILRIAAKHGATQVRLIGSVARGDARPDSDVDLLVTWQQGTSLLDQAALKLELESLLGRKVDIASDGWVKPSIQESVYRDAIAL
jgi:uncharacterized protein